MKGNGVFAEFAQCSFQPSSYLIALLKVHSTDIKHGCGCPAVARCRDTLVGRRSQPGGWGAGATQWPPPRKPHPLWVESVNKLRVPLRKVTHIGISGCMLRVALLLVYVRFQVLICTWDVERCFLMLENDESWLAERQISESRWWHWEV